MNFNIEAQVPSAPDPGSPLWVIAVVALTGALIVMAFT
jgi:hypothetical protein